MKRVTLLLAVVAFTAAQMYDSNNDNFDVNALIADKEALQNFTSCFIHDTHCDEVSSDFKKDLKESYEEACAKCTQAQKHILKKYLEGLKKTLPDQYEEFNKKYDPDGKFSLPLETAIANA